MTEEEKSKQPELPIEEAFDIQLLTDENGKKHIVFLNKNRGTGEFEVKEDFVLYSGPIPKASEVQGLQILTKITKALYQAKYTKSENGCLYPFPPPFSTICRSQEEKKG